MPIIRIGTRESKLALWQALFIQQELKNIGQDAELIRIKSEGELNLKQPLYELGVQGIFTKALDIVLIQNKIDIAVHSLKDVPTQAADGIFLVAVPKRGPHHDLLITRAGDVLKMDAQLTLASSSLRRQAQWLNRYPHHKMVPIRGNINSRLNKLISNPDWSATILAEAGVDRIELEVPHAVRLNWMLPAPAQGALGIFCRSDDTRMKAICGKLNHEESFLCTNAERMFLRNLLGGCTMPIAAHACVVGEEIQLKGNVLSINGQEKAEISLSLPLPQAAELGLRAAELIVQQGARSILKKFRGNQS